MGFLFYKHLQLQSVNKLNILFKNYQFQRPKETGVVLYSF